MRALKRMRGEGNMGQDDPASNIDPNLERLLPSRPCGSSQHAAQSSRDQKAGQRDGGSSGGVGRGEQQYKNISASSDIKNLDPSQLTRRRITSDNEKNTSLELVGEEVRRAIEKHAGGCQTDAGRSSQRLVPAVQALHRRSVPPPRRHSRKGLPQPLLATGDGRVVNASIFRDPVAASPDIRSQPSQTAAAAREGPVATLIGCLVGVEATNIHKVQVPKSNRVITS
jgi:hypothetical protein